MANCTQSEPKTGEATLIYPVSEFHERFGLAAAGLARLLLYRATSGYRGCARAAEPLSLGASVGRLYLGRVLNAHSFLLDCSTLFSNGSISQSTILQDNMEMLACFASVRYPALAFLF